MQVISWLTATNCCLWWTF